MVDSFTKLTAQMFHAQFQTINFSISLMSDQQQIMVCYVHDHVQIMNNVHDMNMNIEHATSKHSQHNRLIMYTTKHNLRNIAIVNNFFVVGVSVFAQDKSCCFVANLL